MLEGPRNKGEIPGRNDGGTGTLVGPRIELPHSTIDAHTGAQLLRRSLSEVLNRVSIQGQAISDATMRSLPEEGKQIRAYAQAELRAIHRLAVDAVSCANRVASRNNLQSNELLPPAPPLGIVDPAWIPPRGESCSTANMSELLRLMSAVHEQAYGKVYLHPSLHDKNKLPKHVPQDIADTKRIMELLKEIGQRCDWFAEQYEIVSEYYRGDIRTVREQGQLSREQYREMVSVIMRHHRRPGDPEIPSKGVVVADVSDQLLQKLVGDRCQVISCYRGKDLVGVSLYNAPEACPQRLAGLNSAIGGEDNATLTLMLVSPAWQGTGVFPTLMHATITALSATGATQIIGEVESTNARAKRAYAKFGGRIHDEISSEHPAPTGESATFVGLSIPMVIYDRPERV